MITLCAEEVYPVFRGDVHRPHWPLDDPAATTGSEEDVLRVFRRVRDEIRSAVREYFDGQSEDTKGKSSGSEGL